MSGHGQTKPAKVEFGSKLTPATAGPGWSWPALAGYDRPRLAKAGHGQPCPALVVVAGPGKRVKINFRSTTIGVCQLTFVGF